MSFVENIKSWIVSIRSSKNKEYKRRSTITATVSHTRWIDNTPSTGDNKRILIVDDEPDVVSTFKSALEDNGFKEQVDTFNDPLLALKHFKAGSYELVILDIIMPQMDGFELYDEIRKIDHNVKVCFITAYEVNYQALRAVFPTAMSTDDIGCFIRKPVEAHDLVRHIEAELR
jgi:CheY-like chemotaxis protein